MNLGLKNKVALITGSSKGLGFATAKQLVKEGARVILCSSSEENILRAIEALQLLAIDPSYVTGGVLDLSSAVAIRGFVEEQASLHNGLDIVVTNTAGPKAGGFQDSELNDLTPDQLEVTYKQLTEQKAQYFEQQKRQRTLQTKVFYKFGNHQLFLHFY